MIDGVSGVHRLESSTHVFDYSAAFSRNLGWVTEHEQSTLRNARIAVAGLGSTAHFSAEMLKARAGIDLLLVPYKGSGPAVTDVIGGQVQLTFGTSASLTPHVKAGKLRALAVTTAQRNPLYPDVPTVAESGYKGFEAVSWSGMSVPKDTPKAIVDKLEAAMKEAMGSPAVKAKMEGQGFVVPVQGSKAYTEFVGKEVDRWTKVIKTAGIKTQ